jgi:hypothetical protein
MNITTIGQPQSGSTTHAPRPFVPQTDLTRGAIQHGLRNQKVLVATEILDDYQEIDQALGLNTAGQILTVLARHIQLTPGGGREENLSVSLHRREDNSEVELFLTLARSRRQGTECLQLFKLVDRINLSSASCRLLSPLGDSGPARELSASIPK